MSDESIRLLSMRQVQAVLNIRSRSTIYQMIERNRRVDDPLALRQTAAAAGSIQQEIEPGDD